MYTLQQYITPILPDLALAALGIAAAAYGICNEVKEHRRRSAMAAAVRTAAQPAASADAGEQHKEQGSFSTDDHISHSVKMVAGGNAEIKVAPRFAVYAAQGATASGRGL